MGNKASSRRLPSTDERAALGLLAMHMSSSYSDATHWPLLQLIWSGMGAEGRCEIPSERWKEFGFQGADPRTDLRSAGMLPLYCIASALQAGSATRFRALAREQAFIAASDPGCYVPLMTACVSLTKQLAVVFCVNGSTPAARFWDFLSPAAAASAAGASAATAAALPARPATGPTAIGSSGSGAGARARTGRYPDSSGVAGFFLVFRETVFLLMHAFVACNARYLQYKNVEDWTMSCVRGVLEAGVSVDGFTQRLRRAGDPAALGRELLRAAYGGTVHTTAIVHTVERKLDDEDELPTLCAAAEAGSAAAVQRLLDAGHDPNAKDEHHWAPLHYAALCGFADVARALLRGGADRNLPDGRGSGWAALEWAATYGHADAMVAILDGQHDAEQLAGFWDAFKRAAMLGRVDIVDAFFERFEMDRERLAPIASECNRFAKREMGAYLLSGDTPRASEFYWSRRRAVFWAMVHQHPEAPLRIMYLPARPIREVVEYL